MTEQWLDQIGVKTHRVGDQEEQQKRINKNKEHIMTDEKTKCRGINCTSNGTTEHSKECMQELETSCNGINEPKETKMKDEPTKMVDHWKCHKCTERGGACKTDCPLKVQSRPMRQFIGTKQVLAFPMTQLAYIKYQGHAEPTEPNNLNKEEGYLVEYTNSPNSNHPNHKGYISWSPKKQFDDAYRENGTPIQRLYIERNDLVEKMEKLSDFLDKKQPKFISNKQWSLMAKQLDQMINYCNVLTERLNDLRTNKPPCIGNRCRG